ncbi:TOX high mobility group box family member 3-like isoform X2 [Tachypleus tridentatus]|uniref:TOX high mobility group box family member 3-like isoform X2 n=1 Tax=Tachypleus tridentatus TaxID=6853 RepID=UPI003FD05B26
MILEATNNFDLQTLNLQDSNQNSAATANFVSVDQTFHTPSFGDEEFSIPTLSMPSSDGNGNTGDIFESQALSHPQTQSQEMTIVMASSPSTTIAPQGIVESPTVQYPGHNMEEMYLPQMREIQPGGGIEMQNIQMLNQSYANHPNNFDQMQTMPPPQVPLSTQPSVIHGHTSLLTTISQTQLMTQLGMKAPLGMARQQGPGSMGSSPGSNHTSPGQETSEDSDDNIPLLMSGVKRPSPEPIEPVNNTKSCKKPKVPKKKKKKDPNEPQKPVSAYALFFRDTQAAIKDRIQMLALEKFPRLLHRCGIV